MLRKILLSPYYLALKIRHALYDKGIWKVYGCEVPTICVGNIAAGGTGKTPHTEMIIRTLLASYEWGDKRIAVLSRGHKRKSSGFQQVVPDGSAAFYGDEPLQIKKKFPGVTVAVDRPRLEGCDFLLHPEKLHTTRRGGICRDKDFEKSDLIVLDDAFQYRDLRAHVNIILVDWSRPLNKEHLLPFGRLRDLPERLHYADIILITKCPGSIEVWEKLKWVRSMGITDYDPDTCMGTDKKGKCVTILFTTINYCSLQRVYEAENDPHFVYARNLILFSGIAMDTHLRRFLSDKYKVIKRFKFADHHKFTGMDFKRILSCARANPTAVIATTEKDSQRVTDYGKVPGVIKERLFQVPIEVGFLSVREKEIFETTLLESLREFHSEPVQNPHE